MYFPAMRSAMLRRKVRSSRVLCIMTFRCSSVKAVSYTHLYETRQYQSSFQIYILVPMACHGSYLFVAACSDDVFPKMCIRDSLYLKKETAAVRSVLTELEDALEKLAKEHTDTVMPGYTHLQRAQPVTLAYHLLAYYQMFSRDMERFDDCLQRIDRCV